MYALWTTNWTTSDYYSTTTTSAVFLCSTMAHSPIQLDRLTCYRVDRALIDRGKACGGRLCGHQWQHQWHLVLWPCCGLQILLTPCGTCAGHTIFQGNLWPYCLMLFTSPPPPTTTTTTTGVKHWLNCTTASAISRQPTRMHFSSWLEISTTQSQSLCFSKYTSINFPTWRNNTMDFV